MEPNGTIGITLIILCLVTGRSLVPCKVEPQWNWFQHFQIGGRNKEFTYVLKAFSNSPAIERILRKDIGDTAVVVGVLLKHLDLILLPSALSLPSTSLLFNLRRLSLFGCSLTLNFPSLFARSFTA